VRKNRGKSSVARSRGFDRSRERYEEANSITDDKVTTGLHKGKHFSELPIQYVRNCAFNLPESAFRERMLDELLRRKFKATK